MKIIDKVCGTFGLKDQEEETQFAEQQDAGRKTEPDDYETVHQSEPPKVVHFNTNAEAVVKNEVTTIKMKVIVIEPKSFDDAQQVANYIRDKRPVVINFENTEAEDARRIIDFISGTTYALNGEIKKVGHNVFLCAPNNVNVSYTEKEKTENQELPWLKNRE